MWPTRRQPAITVAVVSAAVLTAAVITFRSDGRSVAKLLPGTARRQAVAEGRLRTVIPEVRLSATPLAEAVETLNRLSGADIKVDLPALQGAGIDPATPVDMRLRNVTLDQALTALLGYASGGNTTTLVYTLHAGVIVVTTDNALAPYTYAAVYDVRDISLPIEFQTPPDNTIQTSSDLFGDPAHTVLTRKEMDGEIAYLLQELVAPDVWDTAGGNGGRISSVSGRLLVVASWQQHREIERLLSDLRATESR